MKFRKLMLVVAVSSLAACSDKGGDDSSAESGSLLDKAGQMNAELVDTVKEKSQAVADSVSETVETAKQSVNETVEAAKTSSAEMMASAVESSKSLTASEADKLSDESSQAASEQADALAGSVNDSATAAASDANAAIDKAETAVMETAAVSAAALDPQTVTEGKRVYSGNCMSCHAPGIAGAPKVGDAGVWQPRVAQGMDTLYQHALQGFKGATGYMPPKGGFSSLNDAEVKAAVDYMVSASQ